MHASRLRTTVLLTSLSLFVVGVSGCSVIASSAAGTGSSSSSTSNATGTKTSAETGLWDSTTVHSISLSYDEDDYDEMIDAYISSGEKEWISATVVIDGETFDDVGLKLKGNSSLRGLSEETAENPEDLPWIIRLDKFIDDQSLDGTTELVVRGNSSETSLNEAVALNLLAETGLASEQAIAVRFSADDSDESLRLVIENPDDEWMERELGDGLLYKAEAGGDYSYRGDDPEDYTDVFDQEAGDDDLTPLIDFLQWINDADDDTFAADLDQHLDVDAFATYLAFQELVQNSDDIDGPGNNSYLYYDPDTGLMTVVNWDLNLAFGSSPGGGGAGGGGMGGGRGGAPGDTGDTTDTTQDATTAAAAAPGGGGGGRGMGGSNILAERFLDTPAFKALYETALSDLQAQLFDSGDADGILEQWTQTLTEQASDLVDTATIEEESAALAQKIDG